jgi:hypothetical protein
MNGGLTLANPAAMALGVTGLPPARGSIAEKVLTPK